MYHAAKWASTDSWNPPPRTSPRSESASPSSSREARTEFRYGSLQMATPLPEYDDTPAAMTRAAQDRSRPSLGDPALMPTRIIDSVEQTPAPLRLVLCSDSYRILQAAPSERLAEIEAERDTAGLTDITDAA
jgi:hypothetical protein